MTESVLFVRHEGSVISIQHTINQNQEVVKLRPETAAKIVFDIDHDGKTANVADQA